MSRRPPPLQLHSSSTFIISQSPININTPGFFHSLYQANWRNAVLILTVINILYYFALALTAKSDIALDTRYGQQELASVSNKFCLIYFVVVALQTNLAFAIISKRLAMARLGVLFILLSTLSIILFSSKLVYATYYQLTDELILECISLAVEGSTTTRSTFRKAPWPKVGTKISAEAARGQCRAAWFADAPNQLICLIIFAILPSIGCFFITLLYYKQARNPDHSACLLYNFHSAPSRVRSALRMAPYPNMGYIRVPANDLESGERGMVSGGAASSVGGSLVGVVVERPNTLENAGHTKRGNEMNKRRDGMVLSQSVTFPPEYTLTPGPPSFNANHSIFTIGEYSATPFEGDQNTS